MGNDEFDSPHPHPPQMRIHTHFFVGFLSQFHCYLINVETTSLPQSQPFLTPTTPKKKKKKFPYPPTAIPFSAK